MNEQPTLDSQQAMHVKKDHKAIKVFLVIALFLIALGGIGYSFYSWQQNQHSSATIGSLNNTIHSLNTQVSSLKESDISTSTKTIGNVIPIRELGISITVPDSIKDLTYSYRSKPNSASKHFEVVDFSTKTITDMYENGKCSSYGIAPPLGTLEKRPGQFKDLGEVASGPALAKQFQNYFVGYYHPQSVCTDNGDVSDQGTIVKGINDLSKSFSTIKEL